MDAMNVDPTCHLCLASFKTMNSLKTHLATDHSRGPMRVRHVTGKATLTPDLDVGAAVGASASTNVGASAQVGSSAAPGVGAGAGAAAAAAGPGAGAPGAAGPGAGAPGAAGAGAGAAGAGAAGAGASLLAGPSLSQQSTAMSEKCPNCKLDFATQAELRTHFSSTHQEGLVNNVRLALNPVLLGFLLLFFLFFFFPPSHFDVLFILLCLVLVLCQISTQF